MSHLSDTFDDCGFDQIADQCGDLFDYHPVGGDEVPQIVGTVETRHTANEIEASRYENAVELLVVAFKNSATDGIASPARGDYITDAGETVRYYFNSITAENGAFRVLVFVRHAETKTGYRVGDERNFR